MAVRSLPLVALEDLQAGQEADCFALLSAKHELTTRDGKPYLRVTFRNAQREISFPLWQDTPLFEEARRAWVPGQCYKLRAVYRETTYGAQLDISRIRETCDADLAEGFDPTQFVPHSTFDPQAMWDELVSLVREEIQRPALRDLVLELLATHREGVMSYPASAHNHHVFRSGLLEHLRNTTRLARGLVPLLRAFYPSLESLLDPDLVLAGAVLHDLGKLLELEPTPAGAELTTAGGLVGHAILARDLLREAAGRYPLEADLLVRLEHILLAHQREPDGSIVTRPLTVEALVVQYADDLDARVAMFAETLRAETQSGRFTSRRNVLGLTLYRGMPG